MISFVIGMIGSFVGMILGIVTGIVLVAMGVPRSMLDESQEEKATRSARPQRSMYNRYNAQALQKRVGAKRQASTSL